MNYSWHDVIGNLGVVIVLVTYFLLQIDKIDYRSIGYSVSNIIGSIFIIFSLTEQFNLSSFIIEVVWLIISILGLCKALYRPLTPLIATNNRPASPPKD